MEGMNERKSGRSMVAWLVRLFSCCFETGDFQGTGARHALSRSIREKVTDKSAVTPGA